MTGVYYYLLHTVLDTVLNWDRHETDGQFFSLTWLMLRHGELG